MKKSGITLCPGTFLTLILKAKNEVATAHEKTKGISYANSDDDVFAALIRTAFPDFEIPNQNSFHTFTNNYKQCKNECAKYVPIADAGERDKFKGIVNSVEYLVRMREFINQYLMGLELNWLVNALFELIENDANITENQEWRYSETVVKNKNVLRTENILFIDYFLASVWAYVVLECKNNKIDKDIYDSWFAKDKGEFTSGIGTGTVTEFEIKVTDVKVEVKNNLETVVLGKLDDEQDDNIVENTTPDDGIKPRDYFIQQMSKSALAMAEVLDNAVNQIYTEAQQNAEKKKIPLLTEDAIAPDLADYDPSNILFISGNHVPIDYGIFTEYVGRAYLKHSEQKTFLYETKRPFKDFYVCNYVKDWRGMITHIDSVLEWKTGLVGLENRIVISGTGGLGKTMMMNYLMLGALDNFNNSATIPIFVTLRNYDPEEGNLLDFVFREFKRHDTKLSMDILCGLLNEGTCVILMDGLDEIKTKFREKFYSELDELADSYPDATYVISSRVTMNFRALNGFSVYELQPLTEEQSIEMVEKLDDNAVPYEIRQDFIQDILSNRFMLGYDEKVDFLGNPLFLTIMLLTYAENHDIPRQRHLFYEQAYDAMARRHDATKGLTREFKTGLTSRDFKYYFGEFCAITFEEEKYNDFSLEELEEFFMYVIQNEELDVTVDDFIEDITGKICLVYKDGDVYNFVHRSFQEYFAAYFYSRQIEQNYDVIRDIFMERDETDHESTVLLMMYGMEPQKTEQQIFMPFLKAIFEEEMNGLQPGYGKFMCCLYPAVLFTQGEVNEFYESESESAIYNLIADIYDFKRSIDGDMLPWMEECILWECTMYPANWDDPHNPHRANNLIVAKTDEVPEEYYETVEYGEEYGIVGHAVEILINEIERYPHLLKMIFEDETFPLRQECNDAQIIYEKLVAKYECKPERKRHWRKRK